LANTCNDLLACCLRGEKWPDELLDRALAPDEGRALLSIVVERLADLFEPRLCETYRHLFTQVIQRVAPDLLPRLRSEASTALAPSSANRVYVLSRITLGADVAVTSVLLDAAKRRFPDAEIIFVGPRKSFEMFEADPSLRHLSAPYARSGSLADRLRASASLWFDDGIVIDPDSRLTQLGLLSVCDPSRYFCFPSRSYGGDGGESLSNLATRWAQEVFGVEDAGPYIAPVAASGEAPDIAISLGVGENPAKRIEGDFEINLLYALTARGRTILLDMGGSEEERERVRRLRMPGVQFHDGSFASFAAQIARSKLYIGYDSAGGHVASACGVPLISIFSGFASERMLQRWSPNGTVIRADGPHVQESVLKVVTCTSHR
jgi:hypothetical protein